MKRTIKHALILSTLLLPVGASTLTAEESRSDTTLTYSEHVQPILARSCSNCHRPAGLNLGGMIAPMSLMEYDEVRPWARSIAKAVKAGDMPPWDASPVHAGVFRNERRLSPEEIDTLVDWARTGASRGPSLEAPRTPGPLTEDGWSIGEPDLVVQMKEPYLVADDVDDLYVDIEVPIPAEYTDGDHWVQAVEVKPDSSVVHHLLAYAVKPGGSKFDPGAQIGGIAPGNEAEILPDGFGRPIPKDARLIFEVHFNKEKGPGTAIEEQSQMAIRFQKGPIRHKVHSDGIANWTFTIPPHAGHHEVKAEHTFEKDVLFLSYVPHMHLRGSAARYLAYYPDGTEELLLDVLRYDFNWQTSYSYAAPKRIPAGTRVEVTMWYDNSAENPNNPNPNRAVSYGEPTYDEMMIGYVNFTNAEADDFELEPLFPLDLWEGLAGASSQQE